MSLVVEFKSRPREQTDSKVFALAIVPIRTVLIYDDDKSELKEQLTNKNVGDDEEFLAWICEKWPELYHKYRIDRVIVVNRDAEVETYTPRTLSSQLC